MKRINSFTIKKVKLRGFKCFIVEREFDFGDMTIITGANAQGKSSIADAISFAFVGTPFFGDKGLDRLHNPNASEMEVSVTFADETGYVHNITRYRKNDVTTVVFDGLNVRQTHLNEIIGDRDLFLSMFNPLYFIEILGEKGKELLEKMLPVIRHEEVLAELPESTRADLTGEKIFAPEVYIKNRRGEIRICEDNLTYLQGQQDLLTDQRKSAQESLERVNSELDTINMEIIALEAECDINPSESDYDEYLSGFYRRLDELTANSHSNDEIYCINQAISNAELEREKVRLSAYDSPFTKEISDIDAELKVLYAEYQKIANSLKNTQPGFKCPACFHEVTAENVEFVKQELRNMLDKCVAEGTRVKTELLRVKSLETEERGAFDKDKDERMVSLNTFLCEQRGKLENEKAAWERNESQRSDSIKSLNSEIQAVLLKKDNGNLTPAQVSQLAELREIKLSLEAQITILTETVNKPDLTDQIELKKKKKTRLSLLVSQAILYAGKKNELLFKALKMNKAQLLLFDVVKSTGEIKDTFKFTYEGRDYKRLSLSEKIRAGLELAELVKKLSGRSYPTFIDNGESLCVIDNVRPKSQIIFASVTKGKPLSVTSKDTSLRKAG